MTGDHDATDPLDEGVLRFLVGTTASGKSALGLELAELLGAEIVSLDSMSLYRGMDIGTAKPTAEERARVPHHMIDVAEPTEPFDLQRYLALVRSAVQEIRARGREPLFVGGTGLYLAAVLKGLFEGPPASPELRSRMESHVDGIGLAAAHVELTERDPAAAERIHPNDRRRIVRALEVIEQTGRTMTDLQQQWRAERSPREARARVVGLRWPVPEIDARIRDRARQMLEAGWPAEAVRLADAGGLSRSAGQALGYGTALALGRGELGFDEAAAEIALRTRQFARRQRTWFRRFDVGWIDAVEPMSGTIKETAALLAEARRLMDPDA